MLSLSAVREATRTEAIQQFLEERILKDSGWTLAGLSRRSDRLEPPELYRVTYRVRLGRRRMDLSGAKPARSRRPQPAWLRPGRLLFVLASLCYPASAASTSVRAKSSPLYNKGLPDARDSAYAKQSPKLSAAGWPLLLPKSR